MNDNTFKKEKTNKVVIIGDSNVGKTCVVRRFTEDKYGDTQPTIGAMHMCRTLDGVILDIWDTAGQERYKSIIPMYYKGAKAIIVAYDITSLDSFEGAKKWIKEIESYIQKKTVLIILLGTKSDLNHLRVIKEDSAKSLAESMNVSYFECSSKENLNIFEVFTYVGKRILELNNQDFKREVLILGSEQGRISKLKDKVTNCANCI
jgi:small GTP-binding protein